MSRSHGHTKVMWMGVLLEESLMGRWLCCLGPQGLPLSFWLVSARKVQGLTFAISIATKNCETSGWKSVAAPLCVSTCGREWLYLCVCSKTRTYREVKKQGHCLSELLHALVVCCFASKFDILLRCRFTPCEKLWVLIARKWWTSKETRYL